MAFIGPSRGVEWLGMHAPSALLFIHVQHPIHLRSRKPSLRVVYCSKKRVRPWELTRYCWFGNSMGFAAERKVLLRTADTCWSGGEHRLSWHLHSAGGYRAGIVLNATLPWRKIILGTRGLLGGRLQPSSVPLRKMNLPAEVVACVMEQALEHTRPCGV